jgi:TRAP-type mannitol/chloroaromatic compound transport system substrate-binding protein
MKRKKGFLGLSVLAAVLLLFAACGANETGKAETATGEAAKPDFVWKMQVIHGTGHSDYHQNVKTAEEIFIASNGRLKIEVHPNGTFASSLEAFQACGDGVFEMHSSWPAYIRGIDNAFIVFNTGNMQMDAHDRWVWIYEHGGWDLMQEAFDKVNLQLVATEIWGSEVLHANEPIRSINDMRGKKMRTSDPRLLEKNDIAGITLPLEEVFTGLATGAVDLAEFGHLKYNVGLGLTDVTDYGIFPDFWNVHNVTTVVVNRDAWSKLPPDLQKIVEMSFKASEFQHWTRSQYESAVAMRELETSGKMEFIRLPVEEMAALRSQMFQIEKEDSEKHGGLTEKIYDSMHSFKEVWYPYKTKAAWWGAGLSPVEQLGYDPED